LKEFISTNEIFLNIHYLSFTIFFDLEEIIFETSGIYIAIYILKTILRKKKELWKNSNISLYQNIIFKKILLKKPKFFKILL